MLEKLKYFTKAKKSLKEEFIIQFLSDPNHAWIRTNKNYKKVFIMMLSELKTEHINYFKNNPTYFIPCNAVLSCAILNQKNKNMILVFKELMTLLESSKYTEGVAIMLHEMGHIYYRHSEKKIDQLDAQIEADDFAFKLGYGEELANVLLEHVHSIDCRVRISKLTTKLIEQKYNQ
jgi:Zn-dependent protease with chaperone function